jgi:hypothetical protein
MLDQFAPPMDRVPQTTEPAITCATVGVNPVTLTEEQRAQQPQPRRRTFEPVPLGKKTGPLIIHDKRWYFRLVSPKAGEVKRARALMEDFTLNEIASHMVVCFTPDKVPGWDRPFRTKEGEPIRIYAFFDSYLEFYEYMQKFSPTERAFYEIVFGELPQKPHFDIDIDLETHTLGFPNDDIDTTAETLREAVIMGCMEVSQGVGVTLDLTRDILIYSSHGPQKRSYHVIINNKCHDGNNEAKAFYDAVMIKVHGYTQGKYQKQNFVDRGVYSPRQQFRLIGCQKWGSGRPKVFYEQFWYSGTRYTHVYNEEIDDPENPAGIPNRKKLVIVYESMISFTSGCSFLPSLVPAKPVKQYNFGAMPDLEGTMVDQCMMLLRAKMHPCPFEKREVMGHMILLHRTAPSHCPICQKPEPHMKEHPYMFVIDGKVYWDCRRGPDEAKKFFLGYLAVTIEEMQAGAVLPVTGIERTEEVEGIEDDETKPLMFGDFNMGVPTLTPLKRAGSPKQIEEEIGPVPTVTTQPVPKVVTQPNPGVPQIVPVADIPMEQRMSTRQLMQLGTNWAQKKYLRREAEDLTGGRSLATITGQIAWSAGLK